MEIWLLVKSTIAAVLMVVVGKDVDDDREDLLSGLVDSGNGNGDVVVVLLVVMVTDTTVGFLIMIPGILEDFLMEWFF